MTRGKVRKVTPMSLVGGMHVAFLLCSQRTKREEIMYSRIIGILAVLSTLVLANCASQEVKKSVDAEVQAQPAKVSTATITENGFKAIESSPNLTPEQKYKLTNVLTARHETYEKIVEETKKLRGALFTSITASTFRPADVNEIKRRMVKLETQRTENFLGAISDVQKIVGKNPEPHHEIYQMLIMEQQPFTKEVL